MMLEQPRGVLLRVAQFRAHRDVAGTVHMSSWFTSATSWLTGSTAEQPPPPTPTKPSPLAAAVQEATPQQSRRPSTGSKQCAAIDDYFAAGAPAPSADEVAELMRSGTPYDKVRFGSTLARGCASKDGFTVSHAVALLEGVADSFARVSLLSRISKHLSSEQKAAGEGEILSCFESEVDKRRAEAALNSQDGGDDGTNA